MLKNWKKALGLSVLLWVLIFAAFSIVMFIPGIPSILQKTLYVVMPPVLALLCAGFYFKKVKSDVKEGFLLSIFFIIIGSILDVIITIPLFVKSYIVYYTQWNLWLSFLLTIAAVTLMGYFMKKK